MPRRAAPAAPRHPDFSQARERMVRVHLLNRGIRDPLVVAAFRAVPRERFVAPELVPYAYRDRPLPIGAGQTISQPYVVALMIELLGLQPGDRALEIGAGSGYAAAILGRIAREVHTVERHAELAERAARRLADLGYTNIYVHHGDGTLGWPEGAPYDAIVVMAGGPAIPPALKAQLAVGGRLVIPVGPEDIDQALVRVLRLSERDYEETIFGTVRFVPLIGQAGWEGDVI